MKNNLWIFLNFGVLINCQLLKFNNNACTNLDAYRVWFASPKCTNNPNVLATVPDIITRSNKNLQTHEATTDDGYILTLFRIPNESGQPVYLQHGILANSIVWVDKEGNRSLAYYLHNIGYDVWLGNVRGTTYSKKHEKYTIKDKQFWDFNLDLVAQYDISASMKYIAKTTGKGGQIVYIGHSMGTTVSYMYGIGKKEEANSLLKGVISLSPVCYLNNTSLVPKGLELLADPLRLILKTLGINGLFKSEKYLHSFIVKLCRMTPRTCSLLNDIFYGRSQPNQFPPEDLLLYYANWPTGVSRDNLIQYMQIAKSKLFRKFDYGSTKNLELYGAPSPPLYDLGEFTLPLYAYYGVNDGVTPEVNIRRWFNAVGSSHKKLTPVSVDGTVLFDHLTFVYGKNMETLLYPLLKNALDNLKT